MKGAGAGWLTPKPPRRGAKPRPSTYVDLKHQPPYTQDRMRWPSDVLGTYRRADHAGTTETEEP